MTRNPVFHPASVGVSRGREVYGSLWRWLLAPPLVVATLFGLLVLDCILAGCSPQTRAEVATVVSDVHSAAAKAYALTSLAADNPALIPNAVEATKAVVAAVDPKDAGLAGAALDHVSSGSYERIVQARAILGDIVIGSAALMPAPSPSLTPGVR
jgi:hypothetical protein